MIRDDDRIKIHRQRAETIITLIFFAFTIIIARLWFLQIYKGKVLYRYSLENRLRKDPVQAPRGMIFSRNNQILTHNVPRFDVVITPQYLKNPDEVLNKLSQIINMSLEDIKKLLKKKNTQAKYIPVIIKKNLDEKEVAVIETENSKMPGVSVKSFISREYTDSYAGGHLLGYITEISDTQLPKLKERDKIDYRLGDFIGQAGVEQEFDLKLRGKDGYSFMEVDALGRMKRHVSSDPLFKDIRNKEPIHGHNMRLTVDRDMQLTAYDAMKDQSGAVIALDVHSGEVLTMVSTPSFDPTNMAKFLSSQYWNSLMNDPNKPLRNKGIQDHYSPGSTYKTLTAIAALEEKVVNENTKVFCPGYFKMGRTFRCWKKTGHGEVDVYKAIRESCDVYFYKIATKLPINALAKYANMFGLGSKTGINVPRETVGLIPTEEWKLKRTGVPWQLGETLSCVIGQSYTLVTPIQMAVAYAAIANGGKVYRPHVVKEIFTNSGEIIESYDNEAPKQINISEETLAIVRKGLFQVTNQQSGTAWWYKGKGIKMAGKTGTTQVKAFVGDQIFAKCENLPYRDRHHGLFIAFAPYDAPKIAVSVIVEHGCHGSSAAAPVAARVIEKFMEKYYPDELAANLEWEKKNAAAMYKAAKEKADAAKKEAEATAPSTPDEGE